MSDFLKNIDEDSLSAEDLYEYALQFYHGNGVEKNETIAFRLLKKAADKGCISALGELGICYSCGDGVAKDLEKAFKCYYKGAEKGDILCERNLGLAYIFGDGVQKNPEEGAKWLRTAMEENGSEIAALDLGELYAEGSEDFPANKNAAIKCFEFCEHSDDDETREKANFWLGTIYSLHLGDHKKAFKYWLESANLGNAISQNNLGLMYANGWGVPVDYENALHWFEIASANGNDEATQNVAQLKQNLKQTKKQGCYIATAVYGSYDCPEVWTLRRFRDDFLSKSILGRAFVKTYYFISPRLVHKFGAKKTFNQFWRKFLDSFVRKLNAKGYENLPYKDK